MQVPGRNDSPGRERATELDQERNAFPGSEAIDDGTEEEMSSDMEGDEPDLDEEDLEENDLSDEDVDDVEWDEPPTEGTRKS